MFTIDNEEFERNLLLTQAYCEMQLANTEKSPVEILRSFNPEWNGNKLFSFHYSSYATTNWAIDPLEEPNYMHLFNEQLEHKTRIVTFPTAQRPFKGRILLVKVYDTLLDGPSEPASRGFIDVNDCPPIDTWFFLSLEDQWVLYAWIPEQFVSLVDAGIDVHA